MAGLGLAVALQAASGAQERSQSGRNPDPEEMRKLVKEASAVKSRHGQELMDLPGVVGHGIGLSQEAPRKPVIEVYVSRKLTDEERKKFPDKLEGVAVVLVETGEFHARPEGKKEAEKPKERNSAGSTEDPSDKK